MTQTSIALFEMPQVTQISQTFVCFGTPRGGTSMVAGALHGLGIPMGEDLPVNIEDPLFNPDGKGKLGPFIEQMKETIRSRNQTLQTWGWKYPRAATYLSSLHPILRNPRYIVVLRDPVPGGLRSTKGGNSGLDYVRAVLRLALENIRTIETYKAPTLLVSYEKASQNPKVFLKELSEFSGMPLPQDLSPLLEFMTPGSYKAPIQTKPE